MRAFALSQGVIKQPLAQQAEGESQSGVLGNPDVRARGLRAGLQKFGLRYLVHAPS